jgi:hypothetical protein
MLGKIQASCSTSSKSIGYLMNEEKTAARAKKETKTKLRSSIVFVFSRLDI